MIYRNDDYRKRHIGLTLKRATQHPYYRDKWNAHLSDIENTPTTADPADFFTLLLELPPVSRNEFQQHVHPEVDQDDELATATVSTAPDRSLKIRFATVKEARLLKLALGEPLISRSDAALLGYKFRPKPLRMNIIRLWDGVPGIDSARNIVIAGSVESDANVLRTSEQLGREFDIPGASKRIETLCASVNTIKILTRCFIDSGIPQSQFALTKVQTFGSYLGSRARDWLASYWRCPVESVYTLSECPQGGTICEKCGYIDFSRLIVPGLLHLTEDREISTGEGRLVVTSLLPTGLAQPVVKYVSGDLAEWIEPGHGCPEHVGGIRRLGRECYSVVGDVGSRPSVLLSSQDIHDALDTEGVFRENPYAQLSMIKVNDDYTPLASMRVAVTAAGKYTVIISFRRHESHQQANPGDIRARFLRMPRVAGHINNGDLNLHINSTVNAPALPWNFA